MQRKLRKCAKLSMPSLRPCNAKTEVEAPFAVAKDLQNIFLGSDSLSISLLTLSPILAALNYDQLATNRTNANRDCITGIDKKVNPRLREITPEASQPGHGITQPRVCLFTIPVLF